MKKLNVWIEINGEPIHAGDIEGDSPENAVFAYIPSYIKSGYPAISISLPTRTEAYSPTVTKNFFEGLLPEGFARKSVAKWIHASEDDYLTILETLGAECLGAIRISSDNADIAGYKELSMDEVKALAKEGVSKTTEMVTEAHLSLTGASGKVGLYYDEKNSKWLQPIGSAPSTHIVKQSHVRLSSIVTNEQLCLMTAAKLGISIPESFIINTGNAEDDEILFATKRYDRLINKDSVTINNVKRPLRLHQEDFAQALGIAAKNKYETGKRHYLPDIFAILRNYAANPMRDQLYLWDILIYDFLVGNTDNHIKNISLLYSKNLREIRLAPAYDIISTAIYPGNSINMAIGIAGERNIRMIRRNHFAEAAADAGLSKGIALQHFDYLADNFKEALTETTLELAYQGYSRAEDIKAEILNKGGFSQL